jgi:hypothetical protein
MTAQESLSRFQVPAETEAKLTPAVEEFFEATFAKYEQHTTESEDQVRLLADPL